MTVRLNVGHLEEKQPTVSSFDITGKIVIRLNEPVYQPVASFLVSVLAFAALAETYNTPEGGKRWADDDTLVLSAATAGQRLIIRGAPIAAAIAQNYWPGSIQIDLESQAIAYDGDSRLGAIGPFIHSAMQGMFTSYYEEHRQAVEARHGKRPSDWPSAWGFGRVVRNALSHGGSLDIRGPTSVSWGSAAYTQTDHGKPIILTDLWPGDLILLMKAMQDALE